jgi:hypothetical protein
MSTEENYMYYRYHLHDNRPTMADQAQEKRGQNRIRGFNVPYNNTLAVHCPSEKTKFIYPMTHLPLTCQADRPLAIPNCERCNNKIYKQIGHDIMNIPVLKNSGIQLRIIQSIKFKLPIRKMFD